MNVSVFRNILSSRESESDFQTDLDVPFATVDYIQSDMLQCLRIEREYHQIYLDDSEYDTDDIRPPVIDDSFQPFFLGMRHLLPVVPPPSLDLKIRAFHDYYTLPNNICDGIDDVYSRTYHHSMLKWLKNSCSSLGTEATITFDIYLYLLSPHDIDPSSIQGTCEPYMRKLLAPLERIKGVKLIINILP